LRQPYEHQREGADFLIGGGTLLADSMGVGKSTSALEALNRRQIQRTALIVCPPIATAVWEAEAAEMGRSARFVTSKDMAKLSGAPAEVVVASDRTLATNDAAREALLHAIGDFDLIFDECHRAAEPETGTAQSILLSAGSVHARASTTWLLSGTPMPNHPGNLWPALRATAWWRIDNMTYDQFVARYCRSELRQYSAKMQPKRVIVGANKMYLPELRRRLKGWWLRRTLDQVVDDMPVKTRALVPLPARSLAAISDFEKSPEADALREAFAAGGASADFEGLSLSRALRIYGEAKAPAVGDYVVSLLNGGQRKVVVWANHIAALDTLEQIFANYATRRIDGSTSKRDRTAAIRDFQSDAAGSPRIMLAQISAASVATTMTAATRAVFAEVTWSARDMTQAEDRIWRLTQRLPVQIDFPFIRGSLDEAIIRSVKRKLGDWDYMAQGATNSGEK